eukprot:CAMPEP_0167744466 /NCGR_PEP_ID=MMETSP0110_2-20121227/2608_1 /TAXON_ID=629695 /ORGANISM="Gymnochlora sp., Strain CCMP2014" /LENGTH=297 /DNA_ID=CAMNT_0007628993 /DNA_START=15 /DNA_END=908 /DNA_ORIENTATION=+
MAGPRPLARNGRPRRKHGILLIVVSSALYAYVLMGWRGIGVVAIVSPLLIVLKRICLALRSQPDGPPKRSELFNIVQVGGGVHVPPINGESSQSTGKVKYTISSEDGPANRFLMAIGPGTRASVTAVLCTGCRFHLVEVKDGDSRTSKTSKGKYLDELPWSESSTQMVAIEAAEGPKAGARLCVNKAGRARWFRKPVAHFKSGILMTKYGAYWTLKVQGRLLDAGALVKSRAWQPNWAAASAVVQRGVQFVWRRVSYLFRFRCCKHAPLRRWFNGNTTTAAPDEEDFELQPTGLALA